MPSATRNRILMDPIHGVCDLDEPLRRIVDTPEIQRLRLIRQTGLAYLVYPGLEHSRFTHVLGAYGIARRVFRHLQVFAGEFGDFSPSLLNEHLETAFTVAALCHDIGHTAFSHALEPVLLPEDVKNHEDCALLILQTELDLARAIRASECDIDQVVQLLRGDHWVAGLCRLLSGPIDVDRWDYLLRDTHGAGLVYGLHDLEWMIRSIYLWPDSTGRPRLVIDGGRGLVALRHFLAARRSMYEQVYWHRTVRGAERMVRAMFERALDVYSDPEKRETDPLQIPIGLRGILTEGRRPTLQEFLLTDDVAVFTVIRHWAESSRDLVLRYLSRRFLRRRLPKEVGVWSNAIPDEVRSLVRDAVRNAFERQTLDDLPAIEGEQLEQALDYFVLGDRSEFELLYRSLEALCPLRSSERFLRIARDLCSGLASLHELNPPFVHRDLKLDNCGVDYTGRAKIFDLGAGTSEPGVVEGTTLTRAPELFHAGSSCRRESDVWALGAVLFALRGEDYPFVTRDEVRTRPFQGTERTRFDDEIRRRVEDASAPETLKAKLDEIAPTGPRQILADMLAFDPTKRPTAAEARRRWDELLNTWVQPAKINTLRKGQADAQEIRAYMEAVLAREAGMSALQWKTTSDRIDALKNEIDPDQFQELDNARARIQRLRESGDLR